MANLQSSLQMLQNSGIDLSKNANPFGMLALVQQMQQMGGAQRRTKDELMNVLRGEIAPDEYMSYSDVLGEMNKRYKAEPDSFGNKELLEIKKYATMAGKEFDIDFSFKRGAKRAGLNLLDAGLLGLVSNDWIDRVAPALNSGENIMGGVGSALGFITPYGLAKGIAAKGIAGIGKIAQKGAGATQLGKNLGIVGKTVGGLKGKKIGIQAGRGFEKASQKLAKWLTANPARAANAQQALRMGAAMGLGSIIEDGPGGAVLNAIGGMTLGAVGSKLSRMGWKPKTAAVSIYAGLTSPEQDSTSEEHIEHILRILMASGLIGKSVKKNELSFMKLLASQQ